MTSVLVLAALSLSACQNVPEGKHPFDIVRIGPADLADLGSTAYALSQPDLVEGNPILEPFGDAVPVAGAVLKYGFKHALVAVGATPARANVSVEMWSFGATCNNIAVVAGAAPGVSLAGMGLCAFAANRYMKRKYERETGKTLDGLVLTAEPGGGAKKGG